MTQRKIIIQFNAPSILGLMAILGILVAAISSFSGNLRDGYATRVKFQDSLHESLRSALVGETVSEKTRALLGNAQQANPELSFELIKSVASDRARMISERNVLAAGPFSIPTSRRVVSRLPGTELSLSSVEHFEGLLGDAFLAFLPWAIALIMCAFAWAERPLSPSSPAPTQNHLSEAAKWAAKRGIILPPPPRTKRRESPLIVGPKIPLNVPMSSATAALLAEASLRSIAVKRRGSSNGGTIAKINPPTPTLDAKQARKIQSAKPQAKAVTQ